MTYHDGVEVSLHVVYTTFDLVVAREQSALTESCPLNTPIKELVPSSKHKK